MGNLLVKMIFWGICQHAMRDMQDVEGYRMQSGVLAESSVWYVSSAKLRPVGELIHVNRYNDDDADSNLLPVSLDVNQNKTCHYNGNN